MTPPLAPWPTEPANYPRAMDEKLPMLSLSMLANYERARADAWEARCRMAVETLRSAQPDVRQPHIYAQIKEALALIGELPPAGAGG